MSLLQQQTASLEGRAVPVSAILFDESVMEPAIVPVPKIRKKRVKRVNWVYVAANSTDLVHVSEFTIAAMAESSVERSAEPSVETTVDASVEPRREPSVETTVEASVEPLGEPSVETTVEASVEPHGEPSVETTVVPASKYRYEILDTLQRILLLNEPFTKATLSSITKGCPT